MEAVVLVIHLMIAIALVAIVLLQRSEGGALGIGGGGGAGGFMSGRGTANLLTRTTAILAAAFFATSIALNLLARDGGEEGSILDTTRTEAPARPTGGADRLPPMAPPASPAPEGPQVPQSQ